MYKFILRQTKPFTNIEKIFCQQRFSIFLHLSLKIDTFVRKK
jgi:hypothetical protein